jgi:hypothetical protein
MRLHAESLTSPTVFWREDGTVNDVCCVDQVIGLQSVGLLTQGHTVVILYGFCVVASYHTLGTSFLCSQENFNY